MHLMFLDPSSFRVFYCTTIKSVHDTYVYSLLGSADILFSVVYSLKGSINLSVKGESIRNISCIADIYEAAARALEQGSQGINAEVKSYNWLPLGITRDEFCVQTNLPDVIQRIQQHILN